MYDCILREKGPSFAVHNEISIQISTPSLYSQLIEDSNINFFDRCNYVNLNMLSLPKIIPENVDENFDHDFDEVNNFTIFLEKIFNTKLLSIDIWDIISTQ